MLRAAVLRQLKQITQRATTARSHAPSSQLPVGSSIDAGAASSRRFFASNAKGNSSKTRGNASHEHGFTVNGIPLKTLASNSRSALVVEFGDAKVAKTIKALPYHLDRLFDQSTTRRPSVPLLKQIFYAADKCNATWIMKKALDAVEKLQPRSRFDVAMYNALYTALQRRNDHEGLLAVYDDFQARIEFVQAPFPEVIYRFGIVGKFAIGDVTAVEEIVREMRQYIVVMTNEVWSQLMLGFAKAGNEDRALKIFQFMMKDDITKLHEAEMNRVILALGHVAKLQLAFEFYSECQIPLSASVFDALLSVCVQNNAIKEGAAILQNRKRFGLALDTTGYTRVLEALETFDLRHDIASVLHEMKNEGVRFGREIDEIIARNQDYLAGTVFTLRGLNEEEVAAASAEETREIVATLRDALERDDVETATHSADSLVYLVSTQRKDEEAKRLVSLGATTVQPVEATGLVISAYTRAGHRHKILGLVRGLQVSNPPESEEAQSSVAQGLVQLFHVAVDDGDLDQAHSLLLTSLNHASRSPRMAAALQSMAEQATEVLAQKHDSSAALKLVDVLLTQFSEMSGSESTMSLDKVLHRMLGLLVRDGQLKYAFAVLGNAQNRGVELTEQLYASIATSMTKVESSSVEGVESYTADDIQSLWEDCRQRGVPVSSALISSSSSLLARGGETQRALLWSAYKEASDDVISFRAPVFQDLLEVASQDHTSADAIAVYDTAVVTLNSNMPSQLLKTIIDKLLNENRVNEAFDRLETSTVKPPNSVIAVTLRAIVETDCSDIRALRLLQMMSQLHKRGLGVPLASSLMETASKQRGGVAPPDLAWGIVQSFEYRRVASEAMDLKSWKNVFNNIRGLETGQTLYAVAHEACKDEPDFSVPLKHRIEELAEIKQQWIAQQSGKQVTAVVSPMAQAQ